MGELDTQIPEVQGRLAAVPCIPVHVRVRVRAAAAQGGRERGVVGAREGRRNPIRFLERYPSSVLF